jgi:fucose permease
MSSVFCVPPLLFVTFRQSYGISYTLLGTLVLINFLTQLTVDIIFTLFAKRISPKIAIRTMPFIMSAGLLVYATVPTVFPDSAYFGLVLGTVVFSIAAGLSEVLLSPTVAAIPSDNPGRDMSLLHSLYAFGVFTMVIISTLFFYLFGEDCWHYLIIFLSLLPLFTAFLFCTSPMPEMNGAPQSNDGQDKSKRRIVGLSLAALCIFFGSCAENAMANWISTYMEKALNLSKAIGDVLGVAMFAVLLGVARIYNAKFGKNIMRVLLVGMIGAGICYLVAGLSQSVVFVFIACIFTGLFTSMLWPGALIVVEEKIPGAGVTAFALMASAGDFGASVAPQLLGVIIDKVSLSTKALGIAEALSVTTDWVGLKAGMLVCALFPIAGIFVVLFMMRHFRQKKEQK